ncbi:LysR family transcriptional regulator [Mesorhizobium sp. CA8]|uniref:LysR substrate-binding domain-containing protein n=1 Tax=unclassified Mesorhizobium TaxID=325217 RepID=UPI001CC947E8|nr:MULTISPECIES: LysR substrate-binding domain-containing protein [unclassified Mesorhizobium]MBZ9764960.1 LysR family transcriptional regulator [Mesorhizobium sp. CA8]MBZ9823497.1 LysR family transcriptional regulator [Mesorhizobium sp. CA4]
MDDDWQSGTSGARAPSRQLGAENKLRRMISSPNALFAFEAVVRCESFRAGAAELNVTQPSISYQIKKLEEALGVELFLRRGGRKELSPSGLILAKALDFGFRAIENALLEIKRSTNKRVVTLCLSAAQASEIWLPRLSSLRQRYPDIDLNLRIVDHEVDPDEESADISIRLGHGDWSSLNKWYLFPEIVFPVCSPSYLKKNGKITSLEDLASRALLHLAEAHPRGIGWREWFEHLGLTRYNTRERLRFSDYQPLLEAAIMGEGIALGWENFSSVHLKKGTLVRAIDLEVKTEKGFYIVASRSQPSQARHVEDVRNWMLSEFAVPPEKSR